jgi:hypothetical protein
MLKFISWYSIGAPNIGFAMGLSKAWSIVVSVKKSLNIVKCFFSLELSAISKYR